MPNNSKIFFAGLVTESNTNSDIPTTLDSFVEGGLARGRKEVEQSPWAKDFLKLLDHWAKRNQTDVLVSTFAFAQPAAPVEQKYYEKLRDEILSDLKSAQSVEAIMLFLHGAMIAQDEIDCEGDLLQRIRVIVGSEIPILCVLDPHAHLTDKMLKNASVMAFMKEYPHTDGLDRWKDLLIILDGIRAGNVIPTAAVIDCEIIGFWPTNKQPIRGLTDKFYLAEDQKNILTTSFIHGFPWGDTPDTGSKVLVYSNDDPCLALESAQQLAAQVVATKQASQPELLSVDDAIDKMLANDGLVALADMTDNPGGGAPADSTFILQRLLERKIRNVAVGLVYDPELVTQCLAIGIDGEIESCLGGKIGRFSGRPLDFVGSIKGICHDAFQPFASFGDVPMGNSVWIHIEGIDVVVTSIRSQIFSPLALTAVGLDISQHKCIVVKSSNHFYDGFKNIISKMYRVSTPGCLSMDFAQFKYEKLSKPRWPLKNLADRYNWLENKK